MQKKYRLTEKYKHIKSLKELNDALIKEDKDLALYQDLGNGLYQIGEPPIVAIVGKEGLKAYLDKFEEFFKEVIE